ncbi:hypothetical protein B0H17DRAFT_1334726 [Mycena rosella]|uniref:Uncharacterized protein n=1 Tax=Mycena rosella TaxID=1033263 RepID=A0AAD7G7K1_MYCRO|nr:hypothetical protein B0H17DRAFT_1334726 [Mycena rosella]
MKLATANSILPGYLFLCPVADRQADSPSCFRLPECPAYWSLDPTGNEHLSMEEAERLGFPTFELEMRVDGQSWDESVYTGIHQFHQAKGFDPDSQDVARELGCPLFEISTEVDGLFAHIQEINICDDRTETQEGLDSELPQEGECGLPVQPAASFYTAAHQMNYLGTYPQAPAIGQTSLNPSLLGSAGSSAQHSRDFKFDFSLPSLGQAYHLPSLELSSPIQSTQPDVARSSINYSGPSGAQFPTPPPSLWTSLPRLLPIPAPPRPLNLNPAHLDHLPARGSGKRKSRDDDPATDIDIHARRPRKMPKRADLWGV